MSKNIQGAVASLNAAIAEMQADLNNLIGIRDSLVSGSGGEVEAAAPAKRRGRPAAPKAESEAAPRKRKPMSEESRQRIIDAQKKRWAKKRKADKLAAEAKAAAKSATQAKRKSAAKPKAAAKPKPKAKPSPKPKPGPVSLTTAKKTGE